MLAYAGIHPFDMEFHVNPHDPRFDMESMSIFDMEFHVKLVLYRIDMGFHVKSCACSSHGLTWNQVPHGTDRESHVKTPGILSWSIGDLAWDSMSNELIPDMIVEFYMI